MFIQNAIPFLLFKLSSWNLEPWMIASLVEHLFWFTIWQNDQYSSRCGSPKFIVLPIDSVLRENVDYWHKFWKWQIWQIPSKNLSWSPNLVTFWLTTWYSVIWEFSWFGNKWMRSSPNHIIQNWRNTKNRNKMIVYNHKTIKTQHWTFKIAPMA